MMIRAFLLVLACAGLLARASEPIEAPAGGASATVSQPHVTAELIPETTTVEAGKPFDMALHLHSDPGWHTYWINPGDSGLATSIKWTLPPGFTAGPIQWPTPEKHAMGPLVTYGYAGDVYLLTTITPPKGDLPRHFDVKATARWLVCQEECIPGKAELTVPLDSGSLNLRLPIENADLFVKARERLPVENTRWDVDAYTEVSKSNLLFLNFWWKKSSDSTVLPKSLRFFPEQSNVLSAQDADNSKATIAGKPSSNGEPKGFSLQIALQQNGEKPDKLSGVLVSDTPWIGDAKAIYISELPVTPYIETAAKGIPLSDLTTYGNGDDGHRPRLQTATAPSKGTATATAEANSSGGPGYLLPGSPQATGSEPSVGGTTSVWSGGPDGAGPSISKAQPFLIAVLGAAFIGGLILNLMPCVLPVLSLKVFSLMKHAGENPGAAWKQGAAFTTGVVISFWALAGLLLILRAAGNHLGWGFQMQSPGFVLGLIFLFFLLGLNLFGVFELGTSLVGLDAKATGKFHGLTSSFLNGALAAAAATPCTAPFMGSSLGFAAQQPWYIALLIFTFLALGMASPYLLLTIFPGALRFVPKPGAWMESFKQFMGFLLMATVIFLIYVFGALVGEERISWLLLALLLAGIAAWIYGRWVSYDRPLKERLVPFVLMLVFLGAGLKLGVYLAMAPTAATTESGPDGAGPSTANGSAAQRAAATTEGWQPWSVAAVEAGLAQGRPVFVDFTAAWCLSCKVNEQVALGTDAVQKAFKEKNVLLLKADWTHADPEISKALQEYNRDGVPLYLLYSPKQPEKPQVLPEVLTPGIVLGALGNL